MLPEIHVISPDNEISHQLARRALERNAKRVRVFRDPVEWSGSEAECPPSCVLLDCRGYEWSAIDVLKSVVTFSCPHDFIAIVPVNDWRTAAEVMRYGARDFIQVPISCEDSRVALQRSAFRLGNLLMTYQKRDFARRALASLTERETDIVKGILRGHSNKLIAFDTNLSVRTVEAYRSRLMSKLGARSVADVIKLACDGAMSIDQGLRPVMDRLCALQTG